MRDRLTKSERAREREPKERTTKKREDQRGKIFGDFESKSRFGESVHSCRPVMHNKTSKKHATYKLVTRTGPDGRRGHQQKGVSLSCLKTA